MDMLGISNHPTALHLHTCGNMAHGEAGRVYACTAPRCYRPPFQLSCPVCTPPPKVKQTNSPWLRYLLTRE
jgi:hypothetical protein